MKTITKIIYLAFALFAFAFFALLPRAEAVTPAPDGGYPGGNTAEGTDALFNLTSGTANTAVGNNALLGNTTGFGNTALGWHSLKEDSTGHGNTAVGSGALLSNNADANTAVGSAALGSNTTGKGNTAVGSGALLLNDHDPSIENSGSANTAVGILALTANTVGFGNTAIGSGTLFFNTEGDGNTAVGGFALHRNTKGSGNTAVGARALQNTAGSEPSTSQNTAVGVDALGRNTTGDSNTALGARALNSNTTGLDNTAIGIVALENNTTGKGNVALGQAAGSGITNASNTICIGTPGANVSNACFIGNIFGKGTPAGVPVLISDKGRLGTLISSKRFKEDIQPMDKASEALFSLKPVSFRYKKEIDPAGTAQLGLVAEDVEKVNPDLIVRDKEGKPYSVRYEQVNAMLLNEFLKEHRTVQGQQKEIDALKAELKEQKALIQKVSAQIEVTKPAPQTVLNNH